MKYYRRFLHDRLISLLSINKVRLIFGARQVGKTVLLQNILQKENSVFYNLQDSKGTTTDRKSNCHTF